MIQSTLAGTTKKANNLDIGAHFVPVGDSSPLTDTLRRVTIAAAPQSGQLPYPSVDLSHSKRGFPASQTTELAISGKNGLQSSQCEIRQHPRESPPEPPKTSISDSRALALNPICLKRANQTGTNGSFLEPGKAHDLQGRKDKVLQPLEPLLQMTGIFTDGVLSQPPASVQDCHKTKVASCCGPWSPRSHFMFNTATPANSQANVTLNRVR